MGLEPTTSAVTGRRSNQLNYQAIILSPGSVSFPSGDFVIIQHSAGNVKRILEIYANTAYSPKYNRNF